MMHTSVAVSSFNAADVGMSTDIQTERVCSDGTDGFMTSSSLRPAHKTRIGYHVGSGGLGKHPAGLMKLKKGMYVDLSRELPSGERIVATVQYAYESSDTAMACPNSTLFTRTVGESMW